MQHSPEFAEAERSAKRSVRPIGRLAVDQGELVLLFLFEVAKLDGERIRQIPAGGGRPGG